MDTHGGVLRRLAAREEDTTATLQSRKDVVDQPAAGRAGLRVDIVEMPEDGDRPAIIRLAHEESTMAIDSVRKAVARQDRNVPIDARAFPHEHSIVPTSNRDSPAWAPVHLLFNEAKRVANTPLPPGADAVATSMAMAAKVDLICRRVLWLLPRAFDSAADPGTAVFHTCASNWGELALPGWWSQDAKAAAVASLGRVRHGLADICNRRVAYNRSVLAAVTAVRETALAEVKANPDGFEDDRVPCLPGDPPGTRRWALYRGPVATSGWAINPNPEYNLSVPCAAGLAAMLAGRACTYDRAIDGVKAHGLVAENNETINDRVLYGSVLRNDWMAFVGPYWYAVVPGSATLSGSPYILCGSLPDAVKDAQCVDAVMELPADDGDGTSKIFVAVWSMYESLVAKVGTPIPVEDVLAALRAAPGAGGLDLRGLKLKLKDMRYSSRSEACGLIYTAGLHPTVSMARPAASPRGRRAVPSVDPVVDDGEMRARLLAACAERVKVADLDARFEEAEQARGGGPLRALLNRQV